MNRNEKFQIERETVNHHWSLRLEMGLKAIWADRRKTAFMTGYVLVMLLVWLVQPWGLLLIEGQFAAVQRTSARNLFLVGSITGLAGLVVMFGTPFGWKSIQNDLRRVGLVNHAGEAPFPVASWRDKENPRVTVMEFETCGVPLSEWEDKREKIETALNLYVAKITEGSEKRRVLLYTAPLTCALPPVIHWQGQYLRGKDFELVMGESMMGPVTVNLAQIPHILLGGSTGSGKSILLKLLLIQAVKKNALVYIADFKGGVDFPGVWHRKCRIITDKAELLEFLTTLAKTLEDRKMSFRAAGCANISQYNERCGGNCDRIIFACDEVAELLDKTGLSKEDKEQVAQIENKLSVIARQGRAFGIHLILATQRPDATILTGQIRNNIDCRVCGRADSVLSQIILDSGDAAERIPKDAQGRFLIHDGTIFQAYLFDENSI